MPERSPSGARALAPLKQMDEPKELTDQDGSDRAYDATNDI